MAEGYTRRLARWIVGHRLEDTPPEVVDRMKWLILDTLGCGIFGSTVPWGKIATDAITATDRTPGATIWGTDKRASSPHATLLNGTFVQGYELDDAGTETHAGASNVTAGLAVAEERGGVNGKTFLGAMVASYETLWRIGRALRARGFNYSFHGLHPAGINSPFGAAAAVGNMLGFDEETMFHALGLAGNRGSSWESVRVSSMDKRMMQGRGGMNGVHSALLAERGFTGIEDVFETENGFYEGLTQSKDGFDLEELTKELGQVWYTPDTELKRYCSMLLNHGYFHTAKAIREKHHPKAEDIASFDVVVSSYINAHTNPEYSRTDSETFAQFCIPYGVAAMLLEGDTFVDQFAPEKLRDPAFVELARKGRQVVDKALDEIMPPAPRPCPVRITLKNGQVLEETLYYGASYNPLTSEEIAEKFKKLAGKSMGDAQVNRIIEMTAGLEKVEDVSVLAKQLAIPARS